MPSYNLALRSASPDNSDISSGLVEVEFHIGPNNLSRLLEIYITAGVHSLRVKGFTAGGAGGGGGSPAADVAGGGISGGGGGSGSGAIDDIDIPVIPGETLYVKLGRGGYGGAPGFDGED